MQLVYTALFSPREEWMTARERYFEELRPNRGWVTILIEVLLYPFWLLLVVSHEASGEGRWYRRQAEMMVNERPRMSDEEFLRGEGVAAEDAPIWLAVRRALAKSVDVPTTSIYASDRMNDLMRMQFPMADVLEICFRVERELARKVPFAAVQKELLPRLRDPEPPEVRHFAQMVVRAVRRVNLR